MKKVQKKTLLKTITKIGVTVLLVSVLVMNVDWAKSWDIAQSADISLLILYGFLVLLGIIISAYKWKILSDFMQFDFSLGKHFRWYLAGTFVNNFLPSIVGGDTYRALSLGKIEGSRAKAIASVLFDRYSGLIAMAMIAVFFSGLNIMQVIEHPLWLFLFFGATLGVFSQLLMLPGKKWSFFKLFFRFFPKKGERLSHALEDFRSVPLIIQSFSWGAIFAFLGVGIANYILFRALGTPLGLLDFLSVIFFINIISALPVSINNIGVKEWAYYVFFGFLGVAPEISVTAAIMSRLIQMMISFFGVGIFFKKNK